MPYLPAAGPAVTQEESSRLLLYVERELLLISQAFSSATESQVNPRGIEPAKPRAGMIVYADGVGWDPGAGEGLYVYTAGAWVKLH